MHESLVIRKLRLEDLNAIVQSRHDLVSKVVTLISALFEVAPRCTVQVLKVILEVLLVGQSSLGLVEGCF